MINKVLKVLKDQLNVPLTELHDIVVVDDIAKHDDGASNLGDKVVITLLNVQEESTLKNASRYNKAQISTIPPKYEVKMESPRTYVNLYVMISANRDSYENALSNISKVIEVLQANNVLNYEASSINPEDGDFDFSFRIELHSIPFEQLSYVWGLLGGKVMPSVLYKISVVKITANKVPTDIVLIDDVNIQSITVDKQKDGITL
ncbi:hypothetical protein GCM10023210_04360 [Chryseobacterium ginsengisoli]|uniref:Pvc16 N-terminal domain-containing protein n=1 Tax=Chryseobacterium ginsengisoli TaxID=363853 RepID=A0ABP9LW62_9FLAO